MKKLLKLLLPIVITIFLININCSAFNISGYVKDNSSNPISGVTVICGYYVISSSNIFTDITGIDGAYSFTNIPPLSISGVAAFGAGWIFSPSSYTYQPSFFDINKQDQNFWSTQNIVEYSISGHITDNSTPIDGVNVVLASLTTTYTTTTDTLGVYTFTHLLQDLYISTPLKDGWTFSPQTIPYTPLNSNQTDQDFTGTPFFTLSGYVKDNSSGPIGGVTLTLQSLTTAHTKVSDADGFFEFSSIRRDNYTLTPAKNDWFFSPPILTFSPLGSNQLQQNFFGITIISTYSISGYIRDNSGLPVSSVTVALSGKETSSDSTDNTGFFEFVNLSSGNYSIKPSKTNWDFNPSSMTYSPLDVDKSSQNFTGTPQTIYYSISGYVLDSSSNPKQGVTVSLTGGASSITVTNASGYYQFKNLADNSYIITPSSSGYSFSPAQRSYSTLTSTMTNQIFFAGIVQEPPVTAEPVIETVQPASFHFGSSQAIRKKMKELRDKIEKNKR